MEIPASELSNKELVEALLDAGERYPHRHLAVMGWKSDPRRIRLNELTEEIMRRLPPNTKPANPQASVPPEIADMHQLHPQQSTLPANGFPAIYDGDDGP